MYPHNVNCSWRIEAPLGNNITIAFSQLLIEQANNCQYDYLHITELEEQSNNLKTLARYCGTPERVPAPFNTSSNVAFINFVTDNSIAHNGFRMEWVSVGCGGELSFKQYGTLTSPNYPNGYPHNTECLWHINEIPGNSVVLTIEEFDLEGGQGCAYDYLKVFGGPDETSPLLSTLCNKISQRQTITSTGKSMTVKFKTDYSVRGNYH